MAPTAKPISSRTSRKLMKRDALMARLIEARRQRCVIVLGQAGSGKTSTLQAWRQELLSLDFDVAWLSLVPALDQLQRFLRDLLTRIASVDDTIEEEAGLLTEGVESDADIERWIIALVQGIALRQRELVLVLDDLQHLREPRIFRAIQWLLDYAPARLHLTLSSRTALPLSFERLRSRGLVTEVDMRDLRFSADESERYLRGQLGRIDSVDARALHELTDGWVAGLQLFALDLRTKEGRSDARYAPVRVRDAHAFASYFEREVLVRIAPDDLDMLTRASVCSRFCVPLCASLLAPSQPLPRVRARLARLEEDNFFITQVGGAEREPWYRLHPLLRETLLARIEQWPLEQRRALHVAACRWFIARGELEEAVHHAVQAGDMAQAVSLVEASAHDLLSSGELSQLAQLLRQLPGEAILRHFDLHLAQAYLAMYARDFMACDASLQLMEARQQTLDVRQRYDLLLLRCGLAAQQDRPDVVVGLLAALNDIPSDAKDLAWTSRANLLAWAYNHEGAYERASHVFDDARQRNGAQLSALLGRCMLASSLRRQGKLSEAEQLAREVLRAAEQRGAAFGGVACTSAAVLADVLYEIDEVEAAHELLEPRIAAIERLTLPGVVLRSLVTLAACNRLANRDAEAFAVIDRLEDYASRYRFDRILAQVLEFRLRCYLARGETGIAVEIVQRLEALLHRQEGQGSIAAQIGRTLTRARCEMALDGRDFASAAKLLKARTNAAKSTLDREAAELQIQGALASFGMGEKAAARAKLIEGLRIGHGLGLIRGLLDVSTELPQMLRGLPTGEELEPELAFHVGRLLAAADRTHAPILPPARRLSSGPAPVATLSDREYEVLSLLAQAMPNKKIARVLDVSLHTVKFHLKNIYGKLGVAARDEAVARLRDLDADRAAARHAP